MGDARRGSLMPDRVRCRAARTGAWAGSGWTGASAGPCDLAAASPVRSARQTSACRRASSGGRRKCCSRFPLCAPWTCSSGCTSPVIRGRSTERLMWGRRDWAGPTGPWARVQPQSIKCVVAVKYSPGVCWTWIRLHKHSWNSPAHHKNIVGVNI